MIVIAFALSLTAFSAGLFLLNKFKNDNLSWVYIAAAYFVIIASLLNMGATCIWSASKIIYAKKHWAVDRYDQHRMHGKYGMKGYYHHGFRKMGEEYDRCCEKQDMYQDCDDFLWRKMNKKCADFKKDSSRVERDKNEEESH